MAEPTSSSKSAKPTGGQSRLKAGFGFLILLVWRFLLAHDARPATGPVGVRQENPDTAFEPTDWSLGPVALVYLGILILLPLCAFVLILAYPTALPDVSRTLRITPPGPRLETNPESDLDQFRAEEEKRLNGYYWIDKQKGIVHIPIEEAMQKLTTTGVPGFPKAPQ